ncbi:unnamed protein product [Gongylonema pulchrum]|uniref:C2H2-type domain-containing protein n=1 Tax=Gongylonema pulchrum TaxID=637853 RepID=A0A183DP23_9BILA|nr:unnamed protein product [Gongylonema pulchrum]
MPALPFWIYVLILSLLEIFLLTIAQNKTISTHYLEDGQEAAWLQSILPVVPYHDTPEFLTNTVDFEVPAVNQQELACSNIHIADVPRSEASRGLDQDSSDPVISISRDVFTAWQSIPFIIQQRSQVPATETYRTRPETIIEKDVELMHPKPIDETSAQAERKAISDYSHPSTSYTMGLIYKSVPPEIQFTNQKLGNEMFRTEQELIKAELLRTNLPDMPAISEKYSVSAAGPSTELHGFKPEMMGQFDMAKCQCGFVGHVDSESSFVNFRDHLESHSRPHKHRCHWRGCGKNFMNSQLLGQHYFEHLITNRRLVLFRCSNCNRHFWSEHSLRTHCGIKHGKEG